MIARTLVAAMLIAVLPAGPAMADGAAVWQAACARCHRDAAALLGAVPGADEEARAAWLDRFLATHRAPDPSTRAALIAWLLLQAKE